MLVRRCNNSHDHEGAFVRGRNARQKALAGGPRREMIGTRTFVPAVDLWEDEHHVYLEADLPGFAMEDIEVLIHRDVLALRGTRHKEECCGEVSWHRRERRQGTFERRLRLPQGTDSDQVEAQLKDGVLKMRMRKAASAKPRRIEVGYVPSASNGC